MAKALSANGRQTEERQMSSRCADLELFMLIQCVTCNIRVTLQLLPATAQLSSRRCNSALRRLNYPHKVQFSHTTAQLPSQKCNSPTTAQFAPAKVQFSHEDAIPIQSTVHNITLHQTTLKSSSNCLKNTYLCMPLVFSNAS